MLPYNKKIVLENGYEFFGHGFGADREAVAEIAFCTSMSGYQEMITDPACAGQIMVMTYPLIGNYGITDEDDESKTPFLGGLIVREYNNSPSNFRYTQTLDEFLEENSIPGVSGVDTRRLTRIIRDEGAQRVIITDADTSKDEALERLHNAVLDENPVARVSCRKRWFSRTPNHKYDVVAIDCGLKYNIVRMLNKRGCNVTVVPYNTTAEEIMAFQPDGILISNGPGNPENVTSVLEVVRALRGQLPVFGIGMGHELICLAYGAKTYKLRLGHHGGNHPVKNLLTGHIEITSQSHSYAVDADSLKTTGLEITHMDLLDNVVEGVRSENDRLFSVQYYPESAPGPQDSAYLFDQFINLMKITNC